MRSIVVRYEIYLQKRKQYLQKHLKEEKINQRKHENHKLNYNHFFPRVNMQPK